MTFKVSREKSEVDTKLVKISLENGPIKLHGVLSNILT